MTKSLFYDLTVFSSLSRLPCSTSRSLAMLDINEHVVPSFALLFIWLPLPFRTYICLVSLPRYSELEHLCSFHFFTMLVSDLISLWLPRYSFSFICLTLSPTLQMFIFMLSLTLCLKLRTLEIGTTSYSSFSATISV